MEAPPVANSEMVIGFRTVPIHSQAAPMIADQGIISVYHCYIINYFNDLYFSASLHIFLIIHRQTLITRSPVHHQVVVPVVAHQPVADRRRYVHHAAPIRALLY